MPLDSRLYPTNWRKHSQAIRQQTDWCCSSCGKPCRRAGESKHDFEARLRAEHPEWFNKLVDGGKSGADQAETLGFPFLKSGFTQKTKPLEGQKRAFARFNLTVAHLNQRPWDNADHNIGILCTTCHLDMDRKHMVANAIAKKHRAGQLTLPFLLPALPLVPAGQGKEPGKLQIPLW